MKSFTVRVEGHREAPEGKVEVAFTNRKPPEKPKKSKGGEMACAPACYDPFMESVHVNYPMTKEEAKAYPVGHLCKVTLEPTGKAAEADEESAERKPPLMERQRAAVRRVKKTAEKDDDEAEESETEEKDTY